MKSIGGRMTLETSTTRKLLLKLSAGLAILFATALLLAVAEFIARIAMSSPLSVHKLFPEYSRAIYKTIEFDSVANINRFGFRGAETRLLPGQVVVIGDSFAFGWGLPDDETWPKKLQDDLSKSGTPFDVYNLGRPGADPDDYLDIARTYIPVLRPKVLLVSLLQGEDLAQLLQKRIRDGDSQEVIPMSQTTSGTIERYFPGLVATSRFIHHPGIMATSTWEADVRFRLEHSALFKRFGETFALLPHDLQKLIETGNINPALIANAADFPDEYVAPYEQDNAPWLGERISLIVREIKLLVAANGGTLILLSMPHGAYFPTETKSNLGRMGYALAPANSNAPDEFVDKIADSTHTKAILLAQKLRSRNDLDKMWYAFDAHPTRYGSEVLEKHMFEVVRGVLVQSQNQ